MTIDGKMVIIKSTQVWAPFCFSSIMQTTSALTPKYGFQFWNPWQTFGIFSLKDSAKRFVYQNYGCFDNSKMLTLGDLQPNLSTPGSLMWARVFTTSVLFMTLGRKKSFVSSDLCTVRPDKWFPSQSFDTMTSIFYVLNAGMVITLKSREGAHIRAAIHV